MGRHEGERVRVREHCWSSVLFSGLLLQQMTHNNISSPSYRTGGQKYKIILTECHRLTCVPPPKFLCDVCVCVCVCVCVQSLSPVQLFATLWTVAHQAPLSRFPRQQYWSGLLFPICSGKRSGEGPARSQSLQAGKRALPQNRILWYLELGLLATRSMRK